MRLDVLRLSHLVQIKNKIEGFRNGINNLDLHKDSANAVRPADLVPQLE